METNSISGSSSTSIDNNLTATQEIDKSYILDVKPHWQNSTQVIDGVLIWVGKEGARRSIAIKCADEKADPDGNIPLRGITLTPSATIAFNHHFNNDLFERQKIAVLIASEVSLETDREEGKGLQKQPYLFGVDFTFKRMNIGQ